MLSIELVLTYLEPASLQSSVISHSSGPQADRPDLLGSDSYRPHKTTGLTEACSIR